MIAILELTRIKKGKGGVSRTTREITSLCHL